MPFGFSWKPNELLGQSIGFLNDFVGQVNSLNGEDAAPFSGVKFTQSSSNPNSWLDEFLRRFFENPLAIFSPNSIVGNMQDVSNDYQVEKILGQAGNDPLATFNYLNNSGLNITPAQEKYLDSLIENQKTAMDNAFQEHMRDTAYLSAGNQLSSLGLSPSGVLQTGGASSGVSSSPAKHPLTNIALQKYEHRMSLAKQMLSMASSMASAGVYGSALASVKKASGIVAASTAHSGLAALHSYPKTRGIRRSKALQRFIDESSAD